MGQHIADYAKGLAASNQPSYEKAFAKYLRNNLPPEKVPEHFEAAKANITALLTKEKPKRSQSEVENP